jgi:hypothetical protein
MTLNRHDLVLVRVIDKAEEMLPGGAIFTFQDLESGETVVLDNTKQDFKLENYIDLPKSRVINIYTDEDYVKPLQKFFKRRGRR